jgi:hypothetical protein
LYQRPILTIGADKFFLATVKDFINAEKHFKMIYETTQTNTDKRTLTFYHEYVQHHVSGATLKAIVDHIFDPEHPDMNFKGETPPTNQPPPRPTARRYLYRLSELGWVDVHEDEQSDKREKTYYPLKDPLKEAAPKEKQIEIVTSTFNHPTEPDLEAKLVKDFKTWKETISNKGTSYSLSKILFNNKTEIPITEAEFNKIITGKAE